MSEPVRPSPACHRATEPEDQPAGTAALDALGDSRGPTGERLAVPQDLGVRHLHVPEFTHRFSLVAGHVHAACSSRRAFAG